MKAVAKARQPVRHRPAAGAPKQAALLLPQRTVKSPHHRGMGLCVCLTVELRLGVFREAEAECQKRR
jgi:hypothetical protein